MRTRLVVAVVLAALLLTAGCAKPPKSFLRTFDEPGTWKTIEIREALSLDETWRIVVDLMSQKFDLEVLEKDSGYLRTSWKYTFVIRNKVCARYRCRIILKFLGQDWGKVQVKTDAEWREKDGWLTGIDTRLLEEVYGDLQGRASRRPDGVRHPVCPFLGNQQNPPLT